MVACLQYVTFSFVVVNEQKSSSLLDYSCFVDSVSLKPKRQLIKGGNTETPNTQKKNKSFLHSGLLTPANTNQPNEYVL